MSLKMDYFDTKTLYLLLIQRFFLRLCDVAVTMTLNTGGGSWLWSPGVCQSAKTLEEEQQTASELAPPQALFIAIWLLCCPSDRRVIATPPLPEHSL